MKVQRYQKLGHRPWPVMFTVLECAEATGEITEVPQMFVAHWGLWGEKEFKAAVAKAIAAVPLPEGAKEDDPPLDVVLERNAKLYVELIVGWGREVTDADGQPLPYTPGVLAGMITGPDGVRLSEGLSLAMRELRFGIAPAKNFVTSPAPGPTPAAGEAETNSPTT